MVLPVPVVTGKRCAELSAIADMSSFLSRLISFKPQRSAGLSV
jgi:hypothetical protein